MAGLCWSELPSASTFAPTLAVLRKCRARRSALLALATLGALASTGTGSSLALTESSFFKAVEARSTLAAAGEGLSWNATDPSGAYLLRRTVPGREPEYALVKATHAKPPAIPGATVGYRVKGILEKYWSAEASVAYGPLPVESTLLGGLSESSFFHRTEARPTLAGFGELLLWTEADPSGAYMLSRRIPGRELEYALVKATHAKPPAIPGATVGYHVRALLGAYWSAEASLSYPALESEPIPPPTAATVNATPTGPASPEGGWHVAFADGFGAPLGTGPGQDNFVYPNQNACCNPYEDHHGNNANELEVYNASQVRVGGEGLELVDSYWPRRAPAEGPYPVRNYVSGAISTQSQYAFGGWRPFTWQPGGGETWAFECNCRLPADSPLSGVDPGWWSTDPKWTNEIDFFEEWGWGSGCQLSLLTSCLTGVAWLYQTSPLAVEESYTDFYRLFDPSTGFHRYTTVIYPNNTWSEYIDGRLQTWVGGGGVAAAPPYFNKVSMSLLLTNALRDSTATSGPNPYPGFSSGARTFTARSIAVYEDGAHAGRQITGGGVAPGTTVR
jgi:hypothetical protein